VKFADADLIGIPHRITIGDRGLKEGRLEYLIRGTAQAETLPLDEIVSRLAG
jgi:prolyl-tRNA synthetase